MADSGERGKRLAGRSGKSAGRLAIAAVALATMALGYADARGAPAGQAAAGEVARVEAAIGRADLAGRLEETLGDDFAGVWFQSSTAQVNVGLVSPTADAKIAAVAAEAGLAADTIAVPVSSTWQQLELEQKRFGRRVADLFERGEVSTSLDASANAVRIALGSGVPPSRLAGLESAAGAETVRVLIEVAPRPRITGAHAAQCAKFAKLAAFCDPTIVAGVTFDGEVIEEERQTCTTGPAAIPKDRSEKETATKTYLLTAGHCVENNGGEGKKWYAHNKEGEEKGEKEVGTAGPFLNAKTDVGVVNVTSAYWSHPAEPSPVVPAIAQWSAEAETEPEKVKKQATPMEGVKTCFSGQRSGKQCGKILATGVKFKFEGEEVETENLVKVEIEGGKGGKGDSGGPFYTKASPSSAEGTFVGFEFEEEQKEEGKVVFFHSLATSFEKLKEEKALDLELLTTANERRHPEFTAEEYPVTLTAKNLVAKDTFTAFETAVECSETEMHGELTEGMHEEEREAIELTPAYEGCIATGGLPATFTSNGCKYRLNLREKEEEGDYRATLDIVCPEPKPGMQIDLYENHTEFTNENVMCTLTLPPQAELEAATLTNTAGEITWDAGSVEEMIVTIHRESPLCPSAGTESGVANGVLHVSEGLTIAGSAEGEPVEIDMAGG